MRGVEKREHMAEEKNILDVSEKSGKKRTIMIAAVAAVLFAGTFVGAGGRRQEQTADQQAA